MSLLFPQDATSASPTSTTTTTSSTIVTPKSTPGGSGSSDNNLTSATFLFGAFVTFVTLFSALLFFGFLWRYQRYHRFAHSAVENNGGRVPKLCEVWIQDAPSHLEWDSIRPLSVDVDHTSSSGRAITTIVTRTRTRPRFSWFRKPSDGTGIEAPAAPISGVRMSIVIAMPHADAQTRRRSVISQASSVGEDWRRRDYAIGICHSPFREGVVL